MLTKKKPKKSAKAKSNSAKSKAKPIKVKIDKSAKESTPKTVNNKPTQIVPKIYRKIIIISIIAVIVLAVLVVHFSLAKAYISITPEYAEHNISFSAQIVDPQQSNLNIEGKDYLVGRKLETVISQTGTFTPPSSTIRRDKASGQVTLINKYSQDQTLVATTRLLTPENKLFRLTETVTVPAGNQLVAEAIADEAGDQFLIAPTNFTIPGLWEGLQDKIYAQSTKQMKYEEQTSYEVTGETINIAVKTLRDQIVTKAMVQFEPQLSANEYINQDALIVQEVRRATSAVIGDNVKSFDVELELSIKTITYDEQKLLNKIENDINILAEQNQGLINSSDNDISVSITENEQIVNGIIGVIQGKYKIQLANPNIDMNQLKGKSPEKAIQYLTNLSDVSSASITLSPFWLKTIPELENHIKIILNK